MADSSYKDGFANEDEEGTGSDTFNTYIDDDSFFSNSVSIRRRLSIIEKFLILLEAMVTVPLASIIGGLLDPDSFNPFDNEIALITLPPYIVSVILLIYIELGIKNISVNKGVLKTTFTSIFLSAGIFVTSFALMVPFRQAVTGQADLFANLPNFIALGAISAAVYSATLFIVRLVLVLLNRSNKKYAVIIGPREDAESLCRKIIKEDKKKFSIRYVFYEDNGEVSDRIYDRVKKVNTVILMDTLSAENKEKFLLYFNSSLNKDVYICSDYFDIILMSQSPVSINEKFAFEQSPLVIDKVEAFSKRILDILLCLLALFLTLPIWIVCPLVIKLQDGGPVFYSQIRYTKGMRPFKIIKFRSMKVGAEKNGAQLAEEKDPRITRFGRIIRATRIDELPQILNILKGDMSWVGPRPERPEFVTEFLKENPLYVYRYNVKAGLTGLQQVSATYHTDFNDKLKYDLYYIANQSALLDFVILFRTIGTVLEKSMAEGVEEDDIAFPQFLVAQGVLSKNHWDYRSLIYSRSIDKDKRELLKETMEMTMDMGVIGKDRSKNMTTWMPKGVGDYSETDTKGKS